MASLDKRWVPFALIGRIVRAVDVDVNGVDIRSPRGRRGAWAPMMWVAAGFRLDGRDRTPDALKVPPDVCPTSAIRPAVHDVRTVNRPKGVNP